MSEKEKRVSFDPSRPAGNEPFPAATPETTAFPTQPVAPAGPTIQVPRRRSSSSWLNIVLVLAAIVAVGGVAFAVGRNTAPVSAAAAFPGAGGLGGGAFPRGSFAPGQSGVPGGAGNGGFLGGRGGFNLSGTVDSVTGDTLTITTADGQTLEFSLGPDTTYDAKTPAVASDVKVGSKVEVQLAPGAGGRAFASAGPSGPLGTAGSVTVVP
jgi:hypothetical protein